MKHKFLKTILSSFGLLSLTIPFSIAVNQNVSMNLSSLNADTTDLDNQYIDDVQEINRNTQNGILYKTNSSITLKDFFSSDIWTYDLSTSKFLLNEDGSYKKVTSFFTKYNSYMNTIVVVGNYLNDNNETHSFIFQINESDGTPYFINNSPNLSETEKCQRSIITSEKQTLLTKNVSIAQIKSKGNDASTVFLHLFNDDIIKNPDDNKPCRINLRTYAIIEMSFDSKFFEQINDGTYNPTTLLTVKVLPNWSFFVLTCQLNDNGTIKMMRSFIVNDTLNTETQTNGSAMKYDLISDQINNTYVDKLYPNQLIKEAPVVSVTPNPTANNACVIYLPFIGNGVNMWTALYYSQNPNDLKHSTWDFETTSKLGKISHITWDEINKQFYFSMIEGSNTNSSDENNKNVSLYKYDLYSAKAISTSGDQGAWGTIQSLSKDSKFYDAQLTSFLPTQNNSQLYINKFENNTQNIYGYKITMNNGTYVSGQEETITKPIIKDFDEVANSKNLKNKLPQDLTDDELKSVLEIQNYNQSDYSVELVADTVNASNDKGTVNYSLNVSIKKWWDQSSSDKYNLTYDVNLTGLLTNDKLRFELVTNDWIDLQKYNKIQELRKTIFLEGKTNSLTKQDILNYFISYGNGLTFTTSDISLNGDIQDAQIKATTNVNTGVLRIEYEIKNNQDKTSLSSSYKSGSYEWTFDKKLNDWNQIVIDSNKFDNLKQSKYPSEITLKDLVDAIDFSTSGLGYSNDLSKWEWIPKYNESSQEYVDNQLNGILEGTLNYKRDINDPDESSLSADKSKITISSNTNVSNGNHYGGGFKKLDQYIFDYDENNLIINQSAIKYDEQLAKTIASAYEKDEAINNLDYIVEQIAYTKNNWINSKDIKYEINQKTSNDLLVIDLYIPNDVQMNLPIVSSNQLTLNSYWVQSLKNKNANFFDKQTVELEISKAKFNWTIQNLDTTNSVIKLSDLKNSSLNNYKRKLPSVLVSDMKSSNNIEFQKMSNLLDLSNVSTTDVNFGSYNTNGDNQDSFVVDSIRLIPNDNTGELTAYYTLVYPNLNNISKVAEITIKGFDSNNTTMWIWIGVIIGVMLLTISILITVFHLRTRHKKDKVWSTKEYSKFLKKTKIDKYS